MEHKIFANGTAVAHKIRDAFVNFGLNAQPWKRDLIKGVIAVDLLCIMICIMLGSWLVVIFGTSSIMTGLGYLHNTRNLGNSK